MPGERGGHGRRPMQAGRPGPPGVLVRGASDTSRHRTHDRASGLRRGLRRRGVGEERRADRGRPRRNDGPRARPDPGRGAGLAGTGQAVGQAAAAGGFDRYVSGREVRSARRGPGARQAAGGGPPRHPVEPAGQLRGDLAGGPVGAGCRRVLGCPDLRVGGHRRDEDAGVEPLRRRVRRGHRDQRRAGRGLRTGHRRGRRTPPGEAGEAVGPKAPVDVPGVRQPRDRAVGREARALSAVRASGSIDARHVARSRQAKKKDADGAGPAPAIREHTLEQIAMSPNPFATAEEGT